MNQHFILLLEDKATTFQTVIVSTFPINYIKKDCFLFISCVQILINLQLTKQCVSRLFAILGTTGGAQFDPFNQGRGPAPPLESKGEDRQVNNFNLYFIAFGNDNYCKHPI